MADFELPPMASVDDEGLAVLEFKAQDRTVLGDIKFCRSETGDVRLECYARRAPEGSRIFEAKLGEPELKTFLARHLDIALLD
jgi:hypothetical protein